MKKMGICSCVTGAAAVVCMVSIWGLRSVETKRQGDAAAATVLEEESGRSMEQTETESSNSEPETGQKTYKSPMTDEDYELLFATKSFAKSVEEYIVYEFDDDGEKLLTEIVWDIEDPGDIPQGAVVLTEDMIDLRSMERAVCAMEYFCGGTDFRIIDTYYVYAGGVVRFEHDGHEYTCVEAEHTTGRMQICDAVFEVRPTADNSTLWHEPEDIGITGPDGGLIELRETAKAFIQSAEDYVICEYEYEGGRPETWVTWSRETPRGWEKGIERKGIYRTIALTKRTTVDYKTINKALCAIEDFCGGTDFRITDTYYVGSGGNVQFKYDGHEYTCISEASVTDDIRICDAVFEVHSTDGINAANPCVPDEIKVRDEEGVFHTLLTY